MARRPAWVTAVMAAFILGFATMALGVAKAQEVDNGAPVATDDTATTNEDITVTIEVLANDTDPDGDTLTVLATTDPAHGSITLNADGTIAYTPSANFNGADAFTYIADDGNGAVDTAAVTLTVTAVNDTPVASDDETTTAAGTAVTIAVLANDTDVDGDTLSVSLAAPPSHGSAVVNAGTTITYTPDAAFSGTETLIYVASDGQASDLGEITITVTDPNRAPVPGDDEVKTSVDKAIVIAVLENDGDPDGDDLDVIGAAAPVHGTAVVNADETITYTPDAGFNGEDSFTYVVSDGTASATAMVTVKVKAGMEKHDDKAQCKSGGWDELSFRNQGLCVSFFARFWVIERDWWQGWLGHRDRDRGEDSKLDARISLRDRSSKSDDDDDHHRWRSGARFHGGLTIKSGDDD